MHNFFRYFLCAPLFNIFNTLYNFLFLNGNTDSFFNLHFNLSNFFQNCSNGYLLDALNDDWNLLIVDVMNRLACVNDLWFWEILKLGGTHYFLNTQWNNLFHFKINLTRNLFSYLNLNYFFLDSFNICILFLILNDAFSRNLYYLWLLHTNLFF